MLNSVEHEKSFITSGPGLHCPVQKQEVTTVNLFCITGRMVYGILAIFYILFNSISAISG